MMNKKGFIDLDVNWFGFSILLVLALVGLFFGFRVAEGIGESGVYSTGRMIFITIFVVVIAFFISKKMFD